MLTFEDVDKVRKSSANSPLREVIEASRFEVLDRFLELNIDTPEDIINLKRNYNWLMNRTEITHF